MNTNNNNNAAMESKKDQVEPAIVAEETTLDEMEEIAQVIMGGRRC